MGRESLSMEPADSPQEPRTGDTATCGRGSPRSGLSDCVDAVRTFAALPETIAPTPRLPSAESPAATLLRGSAIPERGWGLGRSADGRQRSWTLFQHSISAARGRRHPARQTLLRRNESRRWSKMLMTTAGRHSSIRRAINSWLAVRSEPSERANPSRTPPRRP